MLVDRYHESLLCPPGRKPSKNEVKAMLPYDHRLDTAARLDPEALIQALGEVGVERCRPDVDGHRSSAVPKSPPTSKLIAQVPTCTTSWPSRQKPRSNSSGRMTKPLWREPTWKNSVSIAV